MILKKPSHFMPLLVFCLSAFANDGSLQEALPSTKLCTEAYGRIFHDIPVSGASVTTTRKERRRTVETDRASVFIDRVRELLGESAETPPDKRRLRLRDEPTEPGTQYITDTDYLPKFLAERDGKQVHKARIRIRQYFIVPEKTTVEAIRNLDASNLQTVKLADGDGPFLKMEFKSGKPAEGPDGHLQDMELVVDKPGLVISKMDAEKLRESPETYKSLIESGLFERLTALKLTRDGVVSPVNDPETTREMLHRIGLIHEQGLDARATQTQTNMRYIRLAHKVNFPNPVVGGKPLEVQITVDEQVAEVGVRTGTRLQLNENHRVIELKIPVEYSDKSDEELRALGLSELATIRNEYLALQEVERARPDSSKPANLRRFVGTENQLRP